MNQMELIESLSKDLTPVRFIDRRVGFFFVFLAFLISIVASVWSLGIWSRILDLTAPLAYYAFQAFFLALGLTAAYSTVSMATPGGGRRSIVTSVLILAGSVLPFSAIMSLVLHLEATPLSHNHLLSCSASGLAFGGVVGAALLFWLRRGAPVAPRRAGLHMGVAMGALGTVASALACPITTMEHVGLAHTAPVLLGGLLGYTFVPRLISG